MSEKERYSDAELEEFRKLINDKIAAAQELYDELVEAINNSEHELAAELHPEGHAVVLDKAKMKPGENLYILSEVEIRLHPEFHQLVEHNHRRRSDNGPQELYDELVEAINNSHGNGTGDTSPTFKALEEAADVNERGNIVHLRFIFSLTHSVA